MDKWALRHQEKRAQIADTRTVLALANEKMPEDITVRDICARAQVTIGSFYRLFESKEEAVAAIFMDSNEHFRRETQRLMEMDGSFERLVRFGEIYAGYYGGKDLAYIRARQILYLKDASGRVSTQNFTPPNILVAIVEQGQRDSTLRTDLPARELAMYLSIMLKGFTAEWCEMNGGFDLNSALRGGFRIALDGARLLPVEGADEKGTAGMTGGP